MPYKTTLQTCAGNKKTTSKANIPLLLPYGISEPFELNLNIDFKNKKIANDYLENPFSI